VDDRLNRIRVGVASDEAILTVHQHLDEISVPDEARVVEVTGDIMLEKTVRDRFRPLRGGIELDWLSGTLCTVTAVGEHSTYGTVVLTNSHCGASIFTYNGGEDYHQDQINGYSRIGVEVLDPAPFSGGACPSGRICRWSDAQVIQVDDTVSTWQARLARTHLNSITINPTDSTWTINHSDPTQFCFLTCIQTGSRADKVGKTTGWTSGTQNGQCVNIVAPGSNNVLLLCQATGTYHSAGGDSGSPVFQCGLVYCPDDVPVASVGVKGIHWGRFTTGAQDRIFSPTQYARLDIGGSGPCGGLLLASIYSFYC
jgi:hypothetical protein